ncbi:hypothetical protein BsWGS_07611 [Bradybaena similaris]
MGKSRRRATLTATRSGETSTSRASSSTSQVENLPCDNFQAQTQKLSKDRMITETQPEQGHTRVLRTRSRGNHPYKTSPVAYVSTSATKTTRSPVLAKRICKRNTGRDAVDIRQRKHDDLGNTDLKAARRRVFQGRKGKSQVSSSKALTDYASSVNINHNARSPAAQVSTPADKPQVSTPADKPQVSTPADKPQVSTPADKPQVSTPADKPQVSTPADKPQVSTPADKPQVSTPADKPQVSTPADKPDILACDLKFCQEYEARREARRIIQGIRAMGNEMSFPGYPGWNLNWSCSLMTHDTNVLPPGWLRWSPANM